MSILSVLDISSSALLTAKKALDTTSHNIANASTPGYTRQDAVLTSISGGTTGLAGTSGRGVTLSEVKRMYDSFSTLQLRSEKSNSAYWDTYSKYSSSIENVFNETGDTGISPLITRFFNAWEQVAQNPQSSVQRSALLDTAGQLVSRINGAFNALESQRAEILKSSQVLTGEVNAITNQISNLNEKIAQAPGSLDLIDQRDLLIEQLNEIVKVSTIEGVQGQVSVYAGGVSLVDPTGSHDISAGLDVNGNLQITLSAAGSPDITSEITGGGLKANLDASNTTIVGYQNQLNTLATDLRVAVNAQQTAGFDLDGNAGAAFFNTPAIAQYAARDLRVSITDPRDIAAASSATGVPGDNTNAQAIANLANQAIVAGMTRTVIDYYREMVSTAALDAQSATMATTFQNSLVEQLESKRQETSGVNLDEEAVNLVRYQKSFEAAARMISVANELLDTIINMT